MKKVKDYSKAYDKIIENMGNGSSSQLTEAERKHNDLMGKLIELHNRQYRRVPMEGRLEMIEQTHFELFDELARWNAGYAEMEIADDGKTCTLLYMGKLLLFIEPNEFMGEFNRLVSAIKDAGCVWFSAENDKFQMKLQYDLTRYEFAEDVSEEIEKVNQEMIRLRKEIRRNRGIIL